MKPTPGPWEIIDGRIEAKSARYGQSTGMVILAKIKKHRLGSADRVPPDEVQIANALQMAASPEMFDCVASFVRQFGAAVKCDEDINGGDAVDWIGQNMPEFRNALKKARG
jgi:hypothetical protein